MKTGFFPHLLLFSFHKFQLDPPFTVENPVVICWPEIQLTTFLVTLSEASMGPDHVFDQTKTDSHREVR